MAIITVCFHDDLHTRRHRQHKRRSAAREARNWKRYAHRRHRRLERYNINIGNYDFVIVPVTGWDVE